MPSIGAAADKGYSEMSVTTSVAVTTAARVRGCLLGGAIGDALGAPVSHLSLTEIRRLLGPRGVTGFVYDGRGRISADTQMAMFTTEGLLCAWVHGQIHDPHETLRAIHAAYVRWALTQDEPPDRADIQIRAEGWLLDVPGMHSRHLLCTDCRSTLMSTEHLGIIPAAAAGKEGCVGLLTRVAPVGLFAPTIGSDEAVFDLAANVAGLTHDNPIGRLAAGYFAVVMAGLARGESLAAALDSASRLLEGREGGKETCDAIAAARSAAARPDLSAEALEILGEGRGVSAALAVGICCAIAARTFSEGALLAANHSGTSASTAAITGNMLGAMLGYDALPPDWVISLRLRHEIARLADDLDGAAINAMNLAVLCDPYTGNKGAERKRPKR